jgi:hypothetical protein
MAPRLIARSFALPPARWGASAPEGVGDRSRPGEKHRNLSSIQVRMDRCHSSRVKGAVRDLYRRAVVAAQMAVQAKAPGRTGASAPEGA